MRLAVDTGGTFTDLVVEYDSGDLQMFKSSTTPADPIEGILDAVKKAADHTGVTLNDFLGRVDVFIHGTTHAINAVITENTAKTAFLTTKGHKDILVFREGGRIEPFNFTVPFPKPYIPRSLTFEIPERITSQGKILHPLDEYALIEIIQQLKGKKVEAVAVCLLWSVVNPEHEIKAAQLLDEHLPGIPYTLSHVLNPILREYRRASSTCIDASLKPMMSKYLGGLSSRLQESGFTGRLLMLTSKGGVMEMNELAAAPIHSIGSGPSMAPIAGQYFARIDAEAETAIVADTGGTTYDISLVRRGTIPMTPETWIGERTRGHIIGFPSVDVKSVGAGGGSIAWVDKGGLLHVGPQSAGAVPGPACYDKGGVHPTVTDACLVLGHIDPLYFLGGSMKLNLKCSIEAIEKDICEPLNLSRLEAASAILKLATENMVSAIEEVTIHQGIDPRLAVLIGAGGAAGFNTVAIAKRLGCSTVIIPEAGATFSAQGALISDLHTDYRAMFYTTSDSFDYQNVNKTLSQLITKCEAFIQGPGAGSEESSIELFAEARYKGQIWEIDVPLKTQNFQGPEDVQVFRSDFDRAHKELFTFSDLQSELQFVGWRATARCKLSTAEIGRLNNEKTGQKRIISSRSAYFSDTGLVETQVEMFDRLLPEQKITGPAIIESPFTTVVIDPGATVIRKESGSLVITP